MIHLLVLKLSLCASAVTTPSGVLRLTGANSSRLGTLCVCTCGCARVCVRTCVVFKKITRNIQNLQIGRNFLNLIRDLHVFPNFTCGGLGL